MTWGKWDNSGNCGFTSYADFTDTELNRTIGDASPPIGSIVEWHASMTGVPASLPAGWVECNGQVLSDADSPLNGMTMPNLNGAADSSKRFLRGNSTSGGTGGAATHHHDSTKIGGSYNLPHGYMGQDNTSTDTVLPPYADMRYIIRVK